MADASLWVSVAVCVMMSAGCVDDGCWILVAEKSENEIFVLTYEGIICVGQL